MTVILTGVLPHPVHCAAAAGGVLKAACLPDLVTETSL